MPRPTRMHRLGALYHVASQAMAGTQLFQDSADYEVYLDFLKEAKTRFGFRVYAFVLLPQELHLLVELTNDTTISTIMHALNSRYTKYAAKRHGISGHVFKARFSMTLLEKTPCGW